MNIYFDARWTKFDRHDGVSRYGANLVEALARLHPVTMLICDERQLKLLPKGIPYTTVNNPMSWRELSLARQLNKLGADVVFSPMQVMGSWGKRYKLILTLHDVIYYQFKTAPYYLPLPARVAWRLFHAAHWPQRWLLNHADVVATVSQTSRGLIKQMHLTDRDIMVIRNAPTLKPVTLAKQPSKELVHVGTPMRYKNADLLVRAMPLLPDYQLHIVSKIRPERRAELEQLAGEAKDRVTFWNGASDDQYGRLLQTALASVTASRAEGSSLPLLEAMGVGVPGVVSDLPVYHEICDGGAVYFDPDSPESFATAVRQLEDPAYRHKLIATGKAHVSSFTWSKSAKDLLDVMEEVSQSKA